MRTDPPPSAAVSQEGFRLRFGVRGLLYVTTLFALGVTTYEGWLGVYVVAFLVVAYLVFSATGLPLRKVRVAFFITLVLVILFSAFLSLLRPAVQAARASAGLGRAHWEVKELALATLDYRSKHGRFPPPFSVDANGNRLHSWRTLMLPHLGEQALYNRIRLDEPWDSPANLAVFRGAVLDAMSGGQAFTHRSRPTETHYLAVVGDQTMWPVDAVVNSVPDGEGATLLFMEVASSGVDWFEPADLNMSEAIDLLLDPAESGLAYEHRGLFQIESVQGRRVVAIADASQTSLRPLANRSDAVAMLTRDGGETYPGVREADALGLGRESSVRWAKLIVCFALFVLVALPAYNRPREWLLGIKSAEVV